MNEQSVASTTDLWHYAVGSERRGPVSHATLGKLLASGEISAETYVWKPGMDGWIHLSDADGLKTLVAGIGADAPIEVFVEEDTAFTSPQEIMQAHSALEGPEAGADVTLVTGAISDDLFAQMKLDDEGGLSEDTIIEAVDERLVDLASFSLDAPGEAITQEAPAPTSLQSALDDDPFAASAAPAADPSPFAGASVAAADPFAAPSDPFAEADGEDASASEAGGVHQRGANSVLFSLDDLGREESSSRSAVMSPSADPFVTDTSGLIDIKAIADRESTGRPRTGENPFSSPNLVIPRKPTHGTVNVPIVERRRGSGPWIFAAAAMLLIGGGVIAAIIVTGGTDTPTTGTPAVAAATVAPPVTAAPPAEAAPAPTEGKPAEGQANGVASAEGAAGAATAEGVAAEGAAGDGAPKLEGAEGAVKAEGAVADGAAPTEGAPGPDGAEGAAAAEGDGAPKEPAVAAAKKPARRPTTRRPTTRRPKTPKAPVVAVKAPPKPPEPARPPKNSGNTKRVNDLLSKLNNPGASPTTTTKASDANLPKKLSAASLRSALRQARSRFSKCGDMVGAGASGSIKVQTSFVIQGSSGGVTSARIVSGQGTSPQVQRCVVAELKKTSFSRFRDATMTVNYPIQIL